MAFPIKSPTRVCDTVGKRVVALTTARTECFTVPSSTAVAEACEMLRTSPDVALMFARIVSIFVSCEAMYEVRLVFSM